MADIRNDLTRTAEELAKAAREAAYVAIGIGVLGFHKAQVRRQGLAGATEHANIEGSIAEARKEIAKRVRELDATIDQLIKSLDSSLDPLWQRLPEPAQAVVQHAKEARDLVRARIATFAA
jgi:prefoldin subunit 5